MSSQGGICCRLPLRRKQLPALPELLYGRVPHAVLPHAACGAAMEGADASQGLVPEQRCCFSRLLHTGLSFAGKAGTVRG